MKKPTIIDKRVVHLEKILKADYIPFLGGRPDRVKVITHDDQLNLRILLNTVTTFEELLKLI